MLNRSCVFEVIPLRLDESVTQALVVAFIVIVGDEMLNSRPQRTLTEEMSLSRQASLMLRTHLSACAFRFGLRGGNLTDSTPASFSVHRNSCVNSGSRS